MSRYVRIAHRPFNEHPVRAFALAWTNFAAGSFAPLEHIRLLVYRRELAPGLNGTTIRTAPYLRFAGLVHTATNRIGFVTPGQDYAFDLGRPGNRLTFDGDKSLVLTALLEDMDKMLTTYNRPRFRRNGPDADRLPRLPRFYAAYHEQPEFVDTAAVRRDTVYRLGVNGIRVGNWDGLLERLRGEIMLENPGITEEALALLVQSRARSEAVTTWEGGQFRRAGLLCVPHEYVVRENGGAERPVRFFADLSPVFGKKIENPAYDVLRSLGLVEGLNRADWLARFVVTADLEQWYAAVEGWEESLRTEAIRQLYHHERVPLWATSEDCLYALMAPHQPMALSCEPSPQLVATGATISPESMDFDNGAVMLSLYGIAERWKCVFYSQRSEVCRSPEVVDLQLV